MYRYSGWVKHYRTIFVEAGTINGYTLSELQTLLQQHRRIRPTQLRPAVLLEALHQLQFAGYAMSSAARSNEDFMHRRYWRVHRHM